MCIKCTPEVNDDLRYLFGISPYAKLLQQRQYVPLTDEICKLMNMDLELHPQVIFFTVVILSGAITVNTNNNKAIMLNTAEVYGRTKSIDHHREPYGKLKDGVQSTSLPPPIKTMHQDVWPNVLKRQDGSKLIIGTQVSNVFAMGNFL
ncbi:hypothetical protein BCV72DRAFT_237440 [Rhizopus microsporus var. microsporus]|uniref:Uncharacterized protein n=2 Tax=Rhizopus microsporus TaxID=58291 RepID=A0A2G4SN76_RHIZD|nr:uncharacterized protein RHIMIDRAFT_277311 [Rhizopus microsporus ATCC 52813]XP_023463544.1 uncharacterized protein RHIMIDRAFT_262631 [Rhizopus microsporus ATCC 52813]ORE00732.1 hypothetical protein BCV72DRAFT_237440 [Rhizopus microsporus var. microsporus]PHZ07236.1 hypothetical protein RHIMIDRAFT_277311 [Rhizopus microsporus ATCC 52813]PHZ09836.1 hypothetical protein RHIMIDRAFT_262631 [Rhizopus microsporus ATCC 52813]